MANKARPKRVIRRPVQQNQQTGTQRTAPPPPPPIQYRYSANMPGYEEEYMPPRPVRPAVDNSIEFPVPPRSPAQTPDRTRKGGAQPARRTGRKTKRLRPKASPTRPAQSSARDPARREKRKKRKLTRAAMRRRRLIRRLTALALLVCVIAVGMYLTVTMLFKINAIEVRGVDGALLQQAGPYTSSQILQVLGVQLEENIFSFDADAKAAEMEKQLPLLENIQVKRSYPSTVVVRVTPAVPACAMQTQRGWLVLSVSLKILSVEAAQPDLPTLYGGEPVSTQPGDRLSYQTESDAEDTRLEALNTMLKALEERGLLADVTRAEFADTEQLAFLYQDRISVLLGTLNELDYKMDYVQYMLFNTEGKGCAPTDTGRLDCSHTRMDGTLQTIFAQGAPELPSGYVVPQPAPEPTPEEQPAAPEEGAAPEVQDSPEPAPPAEGSF